MRHLILVLGQPPVFAVAALDVASLVDQPVERHRAGDVLAGVKVEFFGEVVVGVLERKLGKRGDIHGGSSIRLEGVEHKGKARRQSMYVASRVL